MFGTHFLALYRLPAGEEVMQKFIYFPLISPEIKGIWMFSLTDKLSVYAIGIIGICFRLAEPGPNIRTCKQKDDHA